MEAHAGEYIRNYLQVKRFPRISLVCKLVPVQYREYEHGLLKHSLTIMVAVVVLDTEKETLFRQAFLF